jgi:hypothetical protein
MGQLMRPPPGACAIPHCSPWEGQRAAAHGSSVSRGWSTAFAPVRRALTRMHALTPRLLPCPSWMRPLQDKARGDCPAGYGFAKFSDKRAAEAALQALNGKIYMGQELRVNWALPRSPQEGTSHLFVGDLGSEVTDTMLYNAFCSVGVCL